MVIFSQAGDVAQELAGGGEGVVTLHVPTGGAESQLQEATLTNRVGRGIGRNCVPQPKSTLCSGISPSCATNKTFL